jgi:hypothetical protein
MFVVDTLFMRDFFRVNATACDDLFGRPQLLGRGDSLGRHSVSHDVAVHWRHMQQQQLKQLSRSSTALLLHVSTQTADQHQVLEAVLRLLLLANFQADNAVCLFC